MKIYVNAGLDAPAEALLSAGLREHEVTRGQSTASILQSGRGDDLTGIEVVFGQPDPRALGSQSLRFVQLTSAGWARYDDAQLKARLRQNETILCNASSVFAVPVAEHAIAMLLALSRQLPQALVEKSAWQTQERRAEARTLRGEVVLLLGYGAIARAIVTRLQGFGVELHGYRRTVRGDEEIPVVDERGLDAIWPRADHIIDLLPEGAETNTFVDAARLSRCKRGARFYNLGRGSTVDQQALVSALRDKLDAAFLDVTTPEPLPAEHELWRVPNLYITPHVGGGHRNEMSSLVRHFLANLEAFVHKRPLSDRVV